MGELILTWDLTFRDRRRINFFFHRPNSSYKRTLLERRMNYAAYMRKIQSGHTTTIGFQNGQDASLVTMKRQARAQTVTHLTPLTPVPTNFSKIGGTVGNIMEATQQTASPTDQTCVTGYKGFTCGTRTADMTANLIGAKQNCAVCSDAPSSAPYNIVLPCKPFIDPNSYDPNPKDRNPSSSSNIAWTNPPTYPTAGNAPGVTVCCADDPSQLTRINPALDALRVTNQGKQADLRTRFNLPPKLDSLRGPVYNANRN